MGKIVGIRFNPTGKIYDFDAGAFVLNKDDHVIVETRQGLGYGIVAIAPIERENGKERHPLKKVYRLASPKDKEKLLQNLTSEKSAQAYCQQCIDNLGLKMNLFAVETTFDGRKTTFFFTAEGRVDFRQLVKMLVKKLSVRVEMRQVGIRNQAKMIGGLGRCGREVCCSTFIQKFDPVSIRMAKNQGPVIKSDQNIRPLRSAHVLPDIMRTRITRSIAKGRAGSLPNRKRRPCQPLYRLNQNAKEINPKIPQN